MTHTLPYMARYLFDAHSERAACSSGVEFEQRTRANLCCRKRVAPSVCSITKRSPSKILALPMSHEFYSGARIRLLLSGLCVRGRGCARWCTHALARLLETVHPLG
jgi:hypothetical protein